MKGPLRAAAPAHCLMRVMDVLKEHRHLTASQYPSLSCAHIHAERAWSYLHADGCRRRRLRPHSLPLLLLLLGKVD